MEDAAVNEFLLGLNTDADLSKIKSNEYRDMLNGRIVNYNGTSFRAEVINSTKYKFKLRDGFVPVCAKTIKGISYILSFHPGTNQGEVGTYPSPNSNVNHNGTISGFTEVYNPLYNFCGASNDQYTSVTRQDFRTALFKFSLAYQMRMVLREDYDGSVNIYFCDGVNSDKCINSGFHSETGKWNERVYADNSFPNFVNIVNESCVHSYVDSIDIVEGGELENGNWKFYFRYTSDDYNPTSFNAETNAVMVTTASLLDTTSHGGGRSGQHSNKSVKLTLKNIDPAYKYVEVGYCYHFTDGLRTGIFNKKFKINHDSTPRECQILLSSTKESFDVDPSVIMTKKGKDSISKSIADRDQRLFRMKTKVKYGHYPELGIFAQQVKLDTDYSKTFDTVPNISSKFVGGDTEEKSIQDYGLYQNWKNTYSFVGYFSGEAYPFGIVYVFDDGTESDVYPVLGLDDFNNDGSYASPGMVNINGIYRFPEPNKRPAVIYDNNVATVCGIKADITDAKNYVNALPSGNIFEHIVGFYIMRGERKKNLLYQGVLLNTFRARQYSTDSTLIDDFLKVMSSWYAMGFLSSDSLQYEASMNRMPRLMYSFDSDNLNMFPGFLYKQQYNADQLWGLLNENSMLYRSTGINSSGGGFAGDESRIRTQICVDPYYRSLFSLDHFFKKSVPKEEMFLQPLAVAFQRNGDNVIQTLVPGVDLVPSMGDVSPTVLSNHMYGLDGYLTERFHSLLSAIFAKKYTWETNSSFIISKTVHMSPWQAVPLNGFVSYFNEGNPADPTSMFYSQQIYQAGILNAENSNLTMNSLATATNSYVGISLPLNAELLVGRPEDENQKEWLVNLWLSNPSTFDVSASFDVKSEKYFKISSFVSFESLRDNPVVGPLYNGDCFIARASMKVSFNPNKYPTNERKEYSGGGFLGTGIEFDNYSYMTSGEFFEYVAEHEINVSMRHTDGNKTYWPANGIGHNQAVGYANFEVQQESDAINMGYSKTASIVVYNGFNNELPYYTKEFKTRIVGSNAYVYNGFFDEYRRFDLASYKDYDMHYGPFVDIQVLGDYLIGIMESYVGIIPVNERVQVGTTTGELTIGFGNLLPLKMVNLSQSIGSQNQNSIVNSGNFIYGIDAKKRCVWQVSGAGQLVDISELKTVNNKIYEIFNNAGSQSDISFGFPDTPLLGFGISSGFDYKYGDVYWSFLNNSNDDETLNETLVFSEKTASFTSRYSYNTPFYTTINRDFYGVNPNALPLTVDHPLLTARNGFWIFEGGDDYLVIFDVARRFIVEFVSNKTSLAEKQFNWLQIISDGEEFESLEYETYNQFSQHVPFAQLGINRWLNPRYKVDNWRLPVNRAVSVTGNTNNNFRVKSVMSGHWMKIKLSYFGNKQKFINSVISEFVINKA